MGKITSVEGLVLEAEKDNKKIAQVVIEQQAHELGVTAEDIWQDFAGKWKVMKASLNEGMAGEIKSASGLVGGEAHQLARSAHQGKTVFGLPFVLLIARAMAVAEVNAGMGRIVAAPTAGSCGVLPAIIFTVGEQLNAPEDALVEALLTAAGIGLVVAHRATLSGAEGGCQAEVGSAAAMAAAAGIEIAGGSPRQAASAAALALKNLLGLVCDPVAGLVEVPCVKRNAGGAAVAATAIELAIAGVTSTIPVDEVIDAMQDIGRTLPCSLRETAEGGLAVTPTALSIKSKLQKPKG